MRHLGVSGTGRLDPGQVAASRRTGKAYLGQATKPGGGAIAEARMAGLGPGGYLCRVALPWRGHPQTDTGVRALEGLLLKHSVR